MLRQHDRGSHFGRDGINDDIPFILGQGVGDGGLNTTRHVGRVGGVVDGVCDGVLGHISDVPNPEAPVVGPAVQGVGPVVGHSVVSDAIDLESGISDAVGISSGDSVVDGVTGINSCTFMRSKLGRCG